MKKLQLFEAADRIHGAMASGGMFLNVKDETGVNPMTISWGTMGFAWNRDVFMTLVRHSRHTWGMMENAQRFTISIPRSGELKEALLLCGTKSGRDMDKFAAAGLTAVAAQEIDGVIVGECDLHLECRVVSAFESNTAALTELAKETYKNNDHHTLYFGEIVACYTTD